MEEKYSTIDKYTVWIESLGYEYTPYYLSKCTNEEKVRLLNRRCKDVVDFSPNKDKTDLRIVDNQFFIKREETEIRKIFGDDFYEYVKENNLIEF